MRLHASHDSGRGIPVLSGCRQQVFPAKQKPLRSHLPEVWIQPLLRKRNQLLAKAGCQQLHPSHKHSGSGITLWFRSQLAQSGSCPNNQICFTSKTQWPRCNSQCPASANPKSCIWETTRCSLRGTLTPWPWPCLVRCHGRALGAVAQPLLGPLAKAHRYGAGSSCTTPGAAALREGPCRWKTHRMKER